MERPNYADALVRLGLLQQLSGFDPHVAGTPPLGLDLPGSDIDVLCHAPDPVLFTRRVWQAFGGFPDFRIWQWRDRGRPVIAGFYAEGWQFELFGQAMPVAEQMGWRHFLVEQRLLAIGGRSLAKAVMDLRVAGYKTEPAFAQALGLAGDPYQAVLGLGLMSDSDLVTLVRAAGYATASVTPYR